MSVKNTVDFKKVENKLRAAIGLYSDTASKKLEGYAKKDAPWTDRTTNARNSIQGKSEWKGNASVITLSGNMSYSVYLELANGKRYAVLSPTIQSYSGEIINGYRKLIK